VVVIVVVVLVVVSPRDTFGKMNTSDERSSKLVKLLDSRPWQAGLAKYSAPASGTAKLALGFGACISVRTGPVLIRDQPLTSRKSPILAWVHAQTLQERQHPSRVVP
jgi:hypothetical protein